VRRDLERGLNPFVALLPRYLFGAALAAQLVVLTVPLPALRDVARGLLATAVLVGLVALTALVVDYTTTPVGSVAQRLRGLATAWTSAMTVGFTLAWYVRAEATAVAVFGIELVAFAGGAYVYREAVRVLPRLAEQDLDDEDEAMAGFVATGGWPFRPAR
jgi:hypothetical protein